MLEIDIVDILSYSLVIASTLIALLYCAKFSDAVVKGWIISSCLTIGQDILITLILFKIIFLITSRYYY